LQFIFALLASTTARKNTGLDGRRVEFAYRRVSAKAVPILSLWHLAEIWQGFSPQSTACGIDARNGVPAGRM
jgi:hypothetical protein